MIDFYKNELINSVLEQYYNTFSRTLDTCDFVPEKYNEKIHKYIFKNMRKKFKEIDKEDKSYCKLNKQKQKRKISKITRKSFLTHLFKRKQRSDVVNESAESEQSERIKAERLCSAIDNNTSEETNGQKPQEHSSGG